LPIISIMEYIGVVAFSISGAYVAIDEKMDLFGIFVLSTITAVGGGILRDVVMDIGVPAFFSSYITIGLIIIATVTAITIKGSSKWPWFIMICDAIGLSVFSVDAGVKAIAAGYNLPEFLFVSIISGVGGGVLRDVLAQRIPLILRKEVYASAAIIGVLFLWFIRYLVGTTCSTYFALILIVVLRVFCVYRGVNLPSIGKRIMSNANQ